jgi:wyosine [tRNA(Phe)-imidazoG37] synthetase (radical SAM superfamily)
MPIPLQGTIVYGPIRSRRLGISLGINPLSPYLKICSFDCIYCHYGKTGLLTCDPEQSSMYSVEEILSGVENALKTCGRLDAITFSGNGEPTLHPDFPFLVKAVQRLRDRLYPGVPVAVFTNGSTLADNPVRNAIETVELPLIKMDAGDEDTFDKINQPLAGIHLEELIQVMKGLKGLILQSLFIKGSVDNHEGQPYDAWLKAVGEIHPAMVQIYSMHSSEAGSGLEALMPHELNKISEDVRDRLKIKAEATWPALEWLR